MRNTNFYLMENNMNRIKAEDLTEEMIIEFAGTNTEISVPYSDMDLWTNEEGHQKIHLYFKKPIRYYLMQYRPELYEKYRLLFDL